MRAGKTILVFDFTYDGSGEGKDGIDMLSVDSQKLAESRIDRIQPIIFSADETVDVGVDDATPVVDGIGEGLQKQFI